MVLLLVGCSVFEPQPEAVFDGAVEMVAPAIYTEYWREIGACSGRSRPMTAAFYRIDSLSFGPAQLIVGYYQAGADRITLSLTALGDPLRIRHEMLHAHLRGVAVRENAHPVEYFVEKCGSLVSH